MRNQAVFYIPAQRREDLQLAFSRVDGVPLYLRGILTLASAGMTDFTLIAPTFYRRQILKTWQKIIRRRPELHLHLIALDPQGWNTSHYQELERSSASHFLWMSTNTLFTQSWVTEHILPLLQKRKTVIASPQYPMPWAILRPQDLRALSEWSKGAGDGLLDHLLPILKVHGFTATPYAAGKDLCFPLYHRSDISEGEHFLGEYIRATCTAGWVARQINKRISIPISHLLTKLRVSPNTITVFNMLLGLASGIGTGGMTNASLLTGAILFQAASVIDGCDGEVAKLTFRTSKFGQYIDTLADNSALLSFFIGLIIHQYRVSGEGSALAWGGVLLLGLACLLGTMIHYLKHHCDSASFVAFEKKFLAEINARQHPLLAFLLPRIKFLIKKDCFSMLFLILALFGLLPYALFLATVAVWTGFAMITYLRLDATAKSLQEEKYRGQA